jgi:uncharacterized protein YggE
MKTGTPNSKIALRSTLALTAAVVILTLTACALEGTPPASLTTSAGKVAANEPAPPEQTVGYSYDAVQVSGIGKATGVPDLAKLSLEVEVVDDTVAEARDRAAESLQAVQEAIEKSIEEQGIEEPHIATSHFRIRPDYDYSQDGGRVLIGYRVSNGLLVTVGDTDNVGPIIDAAIDAGGDDIQFNSLRFAFSDTAELEVEARDDAVEDLRAKAEQLARAAGRELGDLKLLTEGVGGFGGGGIFQEAALFALDSAASFGRDTPITAGEGEVTVVVFGIYELLPSLEEETEASAGSQ